MILNVWITHHLSCLERLGEKSKIWKNCKFITKSKEDATGKKQEHSHSLIVLNNIYPRTYNMPDTVF